MRQASCELHWQCAHTEQKEAKLTTSDHTDSVVVAASVGKTNIYVGHNDSNYN